MNRLKQQLFEMADLIVKDMANDPLTYLCIVFLSLCAMVVLGMLVYGMTDYRRADQL